MTQLDGSARVVTETVDIVVAAEVTATVSKIVNRIVVAAIVGVMMWTMSVTSVRISIGAVVAMAFDISCVDAMMASCVEKEEE
jgi:hypothetical protein